MAIAVAGNSWRSIIGERRSLVKYCRHRVASMALARKGLLIFITPEVPALSNAIRQQFADGCWVLRRFGISRQRCAIKTSNECRHCVIERLVPELRDRTQKHRGDITVRQ